MSDPKFRFVCVPSALVGQRTEWTSTLLVDGEISLLADEHGLTGVHDLAHTLGLLSVALIRREDTVTRQEETVMAYAAHLPLIWINPTFSDAATGWARARGPMTLLVKTAGPMSEDERHRIDRFVAILGPQSE